MKFIQALGLLLASSLIVSNVEAATFPKCSECSVFATGKDGSLWGWENESFCKIPKKCITKATTTKVKTTTKKTKKVTTTITSKVAATNTATSKKAEATSKVANTAAATATANPSAASTSGPHQTNAQGQIVCNGCTVTGTGGDKSLWGWEDEKSCIIDQAKCQGKLTDGNKSSESNQPNATAVANHKKDASGNLICNECTVTATGGDQVSLWGYEDDASCVIDKVKCKLQDPTSTQEQKPVNRGKDGILICSSCVATETHADTTLWNFENGEKCRVIGSRCNINTTPHSWCSGCVVTGTGDDGALYGWENLQSCLINEQRCGWVDAQGKPKLNNEDNNNQVNTSLL